MSAAAATASNFAIRFVRPFINGAGWHAPTGTAAAATAAAHQQPQQLVPHTLIDPNTGKPLVEILHGTTWHVDEAIKVAKTALSAPKGWKDFKGSQRRDILFDVASAMQTHIRELTWLESVTGKTIKEARADIEATIECFKFFAGLADKIHGRHFTIDNDFDSYTIREPVGVCGFITSFNYPLLLTAWKVAPALACGNTIVIKPAPQTPLTTLYLAHLFSTATSLPRGVFNVVPGNADVGARIASHPAIDKVSFTGSTAVGRKILEASAKSNLNRVALELGGKAAMVVCADADLDKVVEDVVDAGFANVGQNCCQGSRLFLEESIHDIFLQKLKARLDRIKVGTHHSTEEDAEFGPLVDKNQFDRVMSFITQAKADSSIKLLTGGERAGTEGYFIKPTVFYDVDDCAPLAKEEIFGPVLTVVKPFTDLETVIDRANSTGYGLAAGVWTNDKRKADMLVRRLKAGVVWVNTYNWNPPYLPFGGSKMSGFGKDLGYESLDEFSFSKSVQAALL
ncbi:hypothetical protein HK102_002624 [Quaeritorhiza haematococci]|nr:hypothetical protein HK102_002624 [Quaeritorhiza haematococci]